MKRLLSFGTLLGALAVTAAVVSTSASAVSPQIPTHVGGIVPPINKPYVQGQGDLLYHGGPVMTTNKTYAIYWVPSGYSIAPGYDTTISQYFGDVAHDSGLSTNVYATDVQYSSIQYNSTFGASLTDTNAFPASGCPIYEGDITECLTDAQLIAEIDRVINAQGWTRNGTNMFFVFTPRAVGSCFDSQGSSCAYTSFCAYHGSTPSGAIYANQPYARHSGCDEGQYPNGSSNQADPTINVLSHEHNEAITDPRLNAWYDQAGYENGDKCAWDFGTVSGPNGSEYNQTINGRHYFLQREYSNDGHACLQTYSKGGPPPTVTSFTPTSGPVGTAVDIQGTNFTGTTAVKFNGAADPSFVVNSSTDISAHVPSGATTGKISVTTSNGTGTSSGSFTVTSSGGAPTITSFSPTSGRAGRYVTIYGTNFTGATQVALVRGSSTYPATFNVLLSTSIKVRVPNAGAGLANWKVTTPNGSATSSTQFNVIG